MATKKPAAAKAAPVAGKAAGKGKAPAKRVRIRSKTGKPLDTTKLNALDAWRHDEALAMSELCAHMIEGGHLAGFCKDKGFAYSTVSDWIAADAAGRAVMYARAREDRSDLLAEQLVTIADESCSMPITANGPDGTTVVVGHKVDPGRVAQLKLKSDNLKWVASKLKARIYGDKLDVTATMDIRTVSDEAIAKQLATFGMGVIAAKQLGLEVANAG